MRLLAIVSCTDWMESCYDDIPPVPAVDVFTILGDVATLAAWPLVALLAVRTVAGCAVVLVLIAKRRRNAW